MQITILPKKSRVNCNDEVVIEVLVQAPDCTTDTLKLDISMRLQHIYEEILLHDVVHITLEKESNALYQTELQIDVPKDWRKSGNGFGLMIAYEEAVAATAFDFYDPEHEIIRYGFLSDFYTKDSGKEQSVSRFLRSFNITHVQYYDWVYRHHDYHAPAAVYTDMMGKEIDSSLIQSLGSSLRAAGIFNIAYGAVYAAGKEYLSEHLSEALYDIEGNFFDLIGIFFIMNLADPSWCARMLEQYSYAVDQMGFDGIHMDTYGYPCRGFTKSGEQVYLDVSFADFINMVHENVPEAQLIFNNVGNWPVHTTGKANQHAVYIEVWEPYTTYRDLADIISSAKKYGKPVVLAAYMLPYRVSPAGQESRERSEELTAALQSCMLLLSTVTVFGATALLFGETGAILTQAYYNDYTVLLPSEIERLRMYQNFAVRYRELFFGDYENITRTTAFGENGDFQVDGCPISFTGDAGTLWITVHQNRKRKVISLINLLNQKDVEWNRGKQNSSVNESGSITLSIPRDQKIERIYYCSPEISGGAAVLCPYEQVDGVRGPAVHCTIDIPSVFGVLVVE